MDLARSPASASLLSVRGAIIVRGSLKPRQTMESGAAARAFGVGDRVQVYWDGEEQWFCAVVEEVAPGGGRVRVRYEEDDEVSRPHDRTRKKTGPAAHTQTRPWPLLDLRVGGSCTGCARRGPQSAHARTRTRKRPVSQSPDPSRVGAGALGGRRGPHCRAARRQPPAPTHCFTGRRVRLAARVARSRRRHACALSTRQLAEGVTARVLARGERLVWSVE